MSLRVIAELADRVTVGISFDSTLALASRIANGNERLGHAGVIEHQQLDHAG